MSTPPHNIKDRSFAWGVCLAVAFFFFFDFMVMTIEGALKEQLQAVFRFSSESNYTWCIASSFHLGNFLFILPAAYLLDRYPVRRVTLTAFAVAVGSALMMSFLHCWLFVVARFCLGAAHAFCFLCLSTLITRWFSPTKQGVVTGVAIAIGLSGIMVCQYAVGHLHHHLGLTHTLLLFVCFGVCAWGIAYVYVQDYPERAHPVAQQQQPQHPFTHLKQAMSNGKNWRFAAFAAFMNAPYMVYLIHLTPFLSHVHHMASAARMPIWLTLGNILGNPIMGFLSQQWQSRRKPMLLASITTLALTLLLFYVSNNQLFIGLLLFVLGIMISAQMLSYPSIAASNPPYMVASAMSIASLVVMGSIPLFQNTTAHLLDHCSNNHPAGNAYRRGAYLLSFAPFLVAVAVSILIALFMEDSFDKKHQPKKIETQPPSSSPNTNTSPL